MGGVAFVGGPRNATTSGSGDGPDFISVPPDRNCPDCVYFRTTRHVTIGAAEYTLYVWLHQDSAERAWRGPRGAK